jgi:hypothetical protein
MPARENNAAEAPHTLESAKTLPGCCGAAKVIDGCNVAFYGYQQANIFPSDRKCLENEVDPFIIEWLPGPGVFSRATSNI